MNHDQLIKDPLYLINQPMNSFHNDFETTEFRLIKNNQLKFKTQLNLMNILLLEYIQSL